MVAADLPKATLRVTGSDFVARAVWRLHPQTGWFMTHAAPKLEFLWQWRFRPDRAKQALVERRLTWEWIDG